MLSKVPSQVIKSIKQENEEPKYQQNSIYNDNMDEEYSNMTDLNSVPSNDKSVEIDGETKKNNKRRSLRLATRIYEPPIKIETENILESDCSASFEDCTVTPNNDMNSNDSKKETTFNIYQSNDLFTDILNDTNESSVENQLPESPSSLNFLDTNLAVTNRKWKKSILLLWKSISNHKYSNVFLNSVNENDAPNYYEIIKYPMDLNKLKKFIENNQIKTFGHFKSCVIIMLINAMIFNSMDHHIYQMAYEMYEDSLELMNSFESTQTLLEKSSSVPSNMNISSKNLRYH